MITHTFDAPLELQEDLLKVETLIRLSGNLHPTFLLDGANYMLVRERITQDPIETGAARETAIKLLGHFIELANDGQTYQTGDGILAVHFENKKAPLIVFLVLKFRVNEDNPTGIKFEIKLPVDDKDNPLHPKGLKAGFKK